MMKLMRKQLSNQRGVTLIELLAVIVILGILAAVAVPAVMSQISGAKDAANISTLEVLNDAVSRYLISNPVDEASEINIENELIDKGYIQDIPKLNTSSSKVNVLGVTVTDKGIVSGYYSDADCDTEISVDTDSGVVTTP